MNDIKECSDKVNLGECTKGEDCKICNGLSNQLEGLNTNEINFNPNAKVYIPKSKRTDTNGEGTDKNISSNEETSKINNEGQEKLNLNLQAQEYVPNYGVRASNEDQAEEEFEDEAENEELDMIMKDIIDNDGLEEELEEEDEESDEDKWFPKFKDCDCCKGFVYKCKGSACANLSACYCKVKEECDEEA